MIDKILYNGKIYTQSNPPVVSALAIIGEKVVAIGDDHTILALATAHTSKQNLGGKTVIVGLTDGHMHWEWTARALQEIDLFEVPSLDEALARIHARMPKVKAGEWVVGRGWAQGLWASQQFPTAQDIDLVSPHNPAFFYAKSGHAGWVNSLALQQAGITADTPNPEGGEIMRDEHGNPTGILLETAMKLVIRHIPDPTPDTLADYMLHAQDLALQYGLTGFHDYDDPSCLHALQINRERGKHFLRVNKHINKAWFHHALESGIRRNFGDDWLKISCLKLFADGALGPKTALMIDSYIGEPHNYGMVVVPKDEMRELVNQASAHGLPTTVHAIGDKAVRDVLDIYEFVRGEEAKRGQTPHDMRHRIEHVQIMHPDDKYRLRDLNIIASFQPIHATSDWTVAQRYWGERCEWAYNARWQLDLGVVCSFGSDSPVEPFDPFKSIYAAVTRQRDGQPEGGWYPHLCLTTQEAIHGYTIGTAYAAYMEDRLGKLDTGFYADLVVLDRDIYAIVPDEILQVSVVGTMVGGVWRYGGID
jgi:predicted amidohydrolase YtcJ